jgi:hypothetical protein
MQLSSFDRRLALLLGTCAFMVACGGSASNSPAPAPPTSSPSSPPTGAPTATPSSAPTSTPTPTSTPSAAPTATASPAPLTVAPSVLAFDATGSANAQSFTAAEKNYTGTYAESDTCANVASVVPSSSGGPTFTVTPLGAGSCAITIRDSRNNTAVEPVGVTLTTGGIN